MRLPPPARRANHDSILKSLREGFRYAFHFRPIRAILVMLGTISFLSMPYSTLLPAIDSKVIHGSQQVAQETGIRGQPSNIPPVSVSLLGHRFTLPYERTYSLFVGCIGIGAIAGALHLASRKSVLGLGRMIPIATMMLGVGMIWFAASSHLLISLLLLVLTGFGFMVMMASSNTLLQTLVDEDKRGRVMSFYTMAFQGTAPFGALLSGWAAFALGREHGEQITIAKALADKMKLTPQQIGKACKIGECAPK